MADDVKLYRQSVLDGFPNGCLLDLRVRLAVEILKGGMFAGVSQSSPRDVAAYALDLTTELLALSDERGLIESLPDDDALNAQVRHQARRITRFNMEQQVAGNRIMREEQGNVLTPPNPFGGQRPS